MGPKTKGTDGALACLVLSFFGLAVCAYLGFLHLSLLLGELYGGGICGAPGSVFNCHAVSLSPWGSFLGLPLPLWGIIGYLATAALSVIAWQFSRWASRTLTLLWAAALLFVAVDALLLAVMVTQVRYLCALCLLSYLVNLLLLLFSQRALSRPMGETLAEIPRAFAAFLPRRAAPVWIFWGIVVTGGLGVLAVSGSTRFMTEQIVRGLRREMISTIARQPRMTVETQQDPVRGPSSAEIQVVEFSDFFCPTCRRASAFDAILEARYRGKISFTFKNFPLDRDCNKAILRTVHPGACRVAMAAEAAHEQGKFWEFHDLLFRERTSGSMADLEALAVRAGLNLEAFRSCMASGRAAEAVRKDVEEGARLKVTGTPSYLINGVLVQGVLTPTFFEEFLKALRHSKKTKSGA